MVPVRAGHLRAAPCSDSLRSHFSLCADLNLNCQLLGTSSRGLPGLIHWLAGWPMVYASCCWLMVWPSLLPSCLLLPPQAHPSRHQFLLRLLTALVQGPCRAWGPALPRALLVVSSESLDQSAAPAGADTGGPNVLAGPESEASPDAGPEAGPALPPAVLWDWAAGRALAKQLLSRQRESLQLWGAYAWLEGRSGNLKAGGCFLLYKRSRTGPCAVGGWLGGCKLQGSAPLAACSARQCTAQPHKVPRLPSWAHLLQLATPAGGLRPMPLFAGAGRPQGVPDLLCHGGSTRLAAGQSHRQPRPGCCPAGALTAC